MIMSANEQRRREGGEAETQGEGREKVGGRRGLSSPECTPPGLKESVCHIYPISYLLRLQSMAHTQLI